MGLSASGDTVAEVLDNQKLDSGSEIGPDRDNIRNLRVTAAIPGRAPGDPVPDKGVVVAAGPVGGRSSRGASIRGLCSDNRLPVVDSSFPRRC